MTLRDTFDNALTRRGFLRGAATAGGLLIMPAMLRAADTAGFVMELAGNCAALGFLDFHQPAS